MELEVGDWEVGYGTLVLESGSHVTDYGCIVLCDT